MQKFRKWETVVFSPWCGTVGLAMSRHAHLPVSKVGILILQLEARQEGLIIIPWRKQKLLVTSLQLFQIRNKTVCD